MMRLNASPAIQDQCVVMGMTQHPSSLEVLAFDARIVIRLGGLALLHL